MNNLNPLLDRIRRESEDETIKEIGKAIILWFAVIFVTVIVLV